MASTPGVPGEAAASQNPGAALINGVTERQKDLQDQMDSLLGVMEKQYNQTAKLVGTMQTTAGSDEGMFQELLNGVDSLKETVKAGPMGGTGFLDGMMSDDSALGSILGGGGGGNVTAKDRPTPNDLMALPAESSMGYLLLYWKMDEMLEFFKEKGDGGGGESGGAGVGGFFKGLMQGAGGIAAIAASLILFAGALLIFSMFSPADWGNALIGLAAFAAFVIGAVVIAKIVEKEGKTFENFAKGVILLTAGFLLFSFAVWVAAQVNPFLPPALEAMLAFGIFVTGAVVLAKIVDQNKGTFLQFALGVIALTVGLVIFAFAVKLMASVLPDLADAVPGLIAYGLFVLGMAGIALLVGSATPSFLAFAAGSIIMTIGIVLFALAIKAVNAIGPELVPALPILIGMLAFMAGVALLATFMAPILPGLLAFGAGIILFSTGLIVFAQAIKVMNEIAPIMDTGIEGVNKMMDFFKSYALMMIFGLAMVPGMILFGVGMAVFSLGIVAFAGALKAVAKIMIPDDELGGMVPIVGGIVGMNMIMRFFEQSRETILFGILLGPALVLFSVGMAAFAGAMILMSKAITAVAEVGEYVPDGLEGMERIMLFMSNPNGVRMDDDGNLVPGGRAGVVQMMEAMGVIALIKLGMFSDAFGPFAKAMLDMTQAIKNVAEVGDPTLIQAAIDGMIRIMNFIAGPDTDEEGNNISVIGIIEGFGKKVFEKLELLGNALGPFSQGMLGLTQAIVEVKDVGDPATLGLAMTALRDIMNFIAGGGELGPDDPAPENPSVLQLISGFSNKLVERLGPFGEGVGKLAEGMSKFLGVIKETAEVGDAAKESTMPGGVMSNMIGFLERVGQVADAVGGGGGLFGLGASAIQNFVDAIPNFAEGMRNFSGILVTVASRKSSIEQAVPLADRMIDVLKAAGLSVDQGAAPDKLNAFKTSMQRMADGINRFFERDINGEMLWQIARALERIAEIEFGNTFEPFIRFVEKADQIEQAAVSLEKMSEAIQPKEPSLLNQIGGAIGGLFNGGGRNQINDEELAVATAEGRNPMVDGAILTMAGIMQGWDTNGMPGMGAGGGGDISNNNNTVIVGGTNTGLAVATNGGPFNAG